MKKPPFVGVPAERVLIRNQKPRAGRHGAGNRTVITLSRAGCAGYSFLKTSAFSLIMMAGRMQTPAVLWKLEPTESLKVT